MALDLFDLQGWFCPYDGQKLTESNWEWCGNRLLTCLNKHVWEVERPAWRGRGVLEFEPIEMVRCKCGQVVPKRNMRSDNGKVKGEQLCPDCFEVIKRAWRPDPEQSHARLVISPIKRGNEIIFQYEEAVEIRPYPNPYGSGGCWGMGAKKTEAEVEQLIAHFKEWNEEWVNLGVKLEVIRKPEMTAPEYINEREREWVEEHPEDVDSPEHNQMRLIV